ncbi:uncharacterized protein K452DRAFT_8980 [Aplosporella prunicola CBS 121167]|uniref:Tetratricopeptide SHNi-TPR domain-containing protein n=1 Tax=Aplosporella prunicola CBS 121167 TaxID=1176127 RepID=A0A6A6BW33_9PEZI|nr:uncharacterized protein K452DRAFT_8980 [Aplosporella prunicola CBS 121167]KAF2147563.1 hypothetical protein K452DRAFT_8980 [Aplosporella prunicola CBS 121167]
MAASDDPAARLADLLTKANLQYELKNYTAAADIYSEAAEAQSELRGEMAPENADLLYLYGRCLYKVAIAKSDVLGGRVAGEEKKQKKGKRGGESKKAKGAEEGDAREKKPKEEEGNKAAAPSVDSKPYFQIIGDENWDTESDESGSDGEGAASGDEDEDDNDDDDLGTAYEILDLARVLLTKQLDDARAATASATTASPTSNDKGKGKARASTPPTNPTERKLSERLADTHDLQAEINLENERFSDSVSDFRAALTLKQSLYPRESALVAEAHFKLSLALEFASMTRVREAQARAEAGEKVDPADAAAAVDEEARAEAVTHMESAIESCRARIAVEEEALAGLKGERAEEARRQIEDVRDMTEDMEGRVRVLFSYPPSFFHLTHPQNTQN